MCTPYRPISEVARYVERCYPSPRRERFDYERAMADLADRTATEQRRIRRLNRVGLYIFVTGLGFVAFAVVQGLLRLRGAL